MARLIDADALANEITAFHPMDVGGSAMQAAVMATVISAPTVEPDFWTSVKDRQPDVMGVYLTRLSDGTYRILGYYDYIDFDKEPRWLEDYTAEDLVEVTNVTHWRFLPEPPEEKE